MKFKTNLVIGLIAISYSVSIFAEEKNPKDGLIQIGDLLWDVKNNRGGLEWDAATKYCKEKGMRLPSKEELITHQEELFKLEEDIELLRKDRDKINPHGSVNYIYWSSTEYEKNFSTVWIIKIDLPSYVQGSRGGPVRKSYRHSNVRCVKDAEKK